MKKKSQAIRTIKEGPALKLVTPVDVRVRRLPGRTATDRQLTQMRDYLRSYLEGDFSIRLPEKRSDIVGDIAKLLNRIVARNQSITEEFLRVASVVAREGRLSERASLDGVTGAWEKNIEALNAVVSALALPTLELSKVLRSVAEGDLSQRFTSDAQGEVLQIKEAVNHVVDTLRTFASEVTRVAFEVGTEGKLGGQADVKDVTGTWKNLTDNINIMATKLTVQLRDVSGVATAIANGDLEQKITVEARGEILELKDTINTMSDQLRSFAAEVTRVAREVGSEGRLGGQAQVTGVSGTWKGLTDHVNQLAGNLTSQVRGIAKVVTAVAYGDLSQKVLFESKGEIASLADTINGMTGTLRVFSGQVSTVAHEVGFEGKLGGQARVPGAAGTWKSLTDNVNQLALNLTTQVRAIAEVATAVTKGDLTRSVSVEARGEVLQLKDTINQMIGNLRSTTITNKEQDWLKTNLAKFTGMMQRQPTLETLGQLIMQELTPIVSAQYGAFYVADQVGGRQFLTLMSGYALPKGKELGSRIEAGEGLVGQAAFETKPIIVTDLPEGYVRITSGLGEAPPRNVVVFPVPFEGQLKAVIELASFHSFSPIHLSFIEQLAQSIGVVFNMIGANTKLQEISKYKSDFLANMSHELRTPLNSLLILAKLLSENSERTLNEKQIEFAKTIYASGTDLLILINQILDLSKIEAGKLGTEPAPVSLDEIHEAIEQTFREVAKQHGLEFEIRVFPDTPQTVTTDRQRLVQVLTNLLSNAFKFTEHGKVTLEIGLADREPAFLEFRVVDTGPGIPIEQQEQIWEAFQQGDATMARKYGGTGLGLTICRELAGVLGGDIRLESRKDQGSTFILSLPLTDADFRGTPIQGLALPEYETKQKVEVYVRSLVGRTVLLIDDDARNLFAMTSFLESQGAKVISVANGANGMRALEENPATEVVLMDVMMPGVDGFQMIREIRKHSRFESLPIIAVTAKAMAGDRERAREGGFTEFVAKPVEKDALLSAVLSSLRRR